MPSISVIMPVYNVEEYLKRSIESVLQQTFSDWELILVNDGSTDNSKEICLSYSTKDKRIKVYSQKNCGSGAARQLGLNKSKGQYICFIDPDDFIHENAFVNNVKIIENYEVDIVVNSYFEYKKDYAGKIKITDRNISGQGLYPRDKFRNEYYSLENDGGLTALWNKMYKKKFLDNNDIKFNNQRVGQDAVFNYNAYKYVDNLYFDNQSYYYYDQTREGSAVKKFNEKKFNYELNIAQTYENMFEFWGMSGKYSKKISYRYWLTIQNELVNLIVSSSPLSVKEASLKVKEITENSIIEKKIQGLTVKDINGPVSKMIFSLIRNKHFTKAIRLMKFYNKAKLKY